MAVLPDSIRCRVSKEIAGAAPVYKVSVSYAGKTVHHIFSEREFDGLAEAIRRVREASPTRGEVSWCDVILDPEEGDL